MSTLEVVVRPVVLPNIRPLAPRVLPPEDDPKQGIATLGGSGGRLIDLPHSYEAGWTKQHNRETERVYDIDKIHQKLDDGTINRENWVRVERATRIKTGDVDIKFGKPPQADNITTEEIDLVRLFPLSKGKV